MIRLRRKLKKTFKNVILHKLYLNPLNLVWELFVFSFLPLSNELREVVRRNKAWKGWIFAENFHLWCRELCGCKTEMGTVDGGLWIELVWDISSVEGYNLTVPWFKSWDCPRLLYCEGIYESRRDLILWKDSLGCVESVECAVQMNTNVIILLKLFWFPPSGN